MRVLILCMMVLPVISDIRHRSFWAVPPVVMTVLILILQIITGIYNAKGVVPVEHAENSEGVMIAREAASRIAAVIPGITFMLLSRAKNAGIGAGDGLMLILLGILTGFPATMSTCIISLLMTAAAGIIAALVKGTGRGTSLPYIPFLMAAYLVQCMTA